MWLYQGGGGGRERERDRQTDRDIQTETDRDRNRQTDIHTYTDRQTDKENSNTLFPKDCCVGSFKRVQQLVLAEMLPIKREGWERGGCELRGERGV